MSSTTTDTMIGLIKSCGYRVFMRDPKAEYCFYTDGERIGYAQWSRHSSAYVSSVHMPNKKTGTGYQIDHAITPETLEKAIKCHTPLWAGQSDAAATKKYKSWEEFHKSSRFNSELFEV